MKDIVIIGGGVGGLACSIRLAEQGRQAVVLEGGTIGAQKVCGGFLSPETLAPLTRWGVEPPISLESITLRRASRSVEYTFPARAGSMRRNELELGLLREAQRLGVEIREGVMVSDYSAGEVKTSEGLIEAKQVVVSSGRLTSKPSSFPYVGFQRFIDRSDLDGLLMETFPGGYVGTSAVSSSQVNCALLMREGAKVPEHLGTFDESWKTTKIPEFGLKSLQPKPGVFAVGDALATIPPATGSGLSLSISTGCWVADAIVQNQAPTFLPQLRKTVWWGRFLHRLFLSPLFVPVPVAPLFSTFFGRSRLFSDGAL